MLTFATKKKQSPSSRPHRQPKNPRSSPQQHPDVRQILGKHSVQPKLAIGAPNDKYEQEADRVADRVMHMPGPQLQRHAHPEHADKKLIQTKSLSTQITPLVQRQIGNPGEEVDQEELLQAKFVPGHFISLAPEVAGSINGSPRQLKRT